MDEMEIRAIFSIRFSFQPCRTAIDVCDDASAVGSGQLNGAAYGYARVSFHTLAQSSMLSIMFSKLSDEMHGPLRDYKRICLGEDD